MTRRYVAVLPVKPPAVGKSRLRGPSDEERRALAEAFALDTAAACLRATAVTDVLVVTDDFRLASRLRDIGCVAMPDAGSDGLNSSLMLAVSECRRRWPEALPAAICADLPALRPSDLDTALAITPVDVPAFVADAAGVGTTLYRAPAGQFQPRFGPASRTAHLEGGALEIGGELEGLRLDVDELGDLEAALQLGVGPHTAELVERLDLESLQ